MSLWRVETTNCLRYLDPRGIVLKFLSKEQEGLTILAKIFVIILTLEPYHISRFISLIMKPRLNICVFHIFICAVSCQISTELKPSPINLTQSIFQHLDPDCHLILAHHNNFQNSDILSSPIQSKKGIYIYHLPQINITTWTSFFGPELNQYSNRCGIHEIPQKAQFHTSAFCFIGVILTQKSDFGRKLEELSANEFFRLTSHQTDIFYKFIYSKYYRHGDNEKTNLHISLLIRVQLDFTRFMNDGDMSSSIFTIILHLVLAQKQDKWYQVKQISFSGINSTELSTRHVQQAIINHSCFKDLIEPPTILYFRTNRRSFLNLHGYYSLKESCEAYSKDPFYLIREQLYRPRAVLFFSLVCLGNFTYGKAYDTSVSEDVSRERRGDEKFTYREGIIMDIYREIPSAHVLYVTTVK